MAAQEGCPLSYPEIDVLLFAVNAQADGQVLTYYRAVESHSALADSEWFRAYKPGTYLRSCRMENTWQGGYLAKDETRYAGDQRLPPA